MVCKRRGIREFFGPSRVLTTMAPRKYLKLELDVFCSGDKNQWHDVYGRYSRSLS